MAGEGMLIAEARNQTKELCQRLDVLIFEQQQTNRLAAALIAEQQSTNRLLVTLMQGLQVPDPMTEPSSSPQ